MLKVLIDKPKKNEQILIALLWDKPTNYNVLKSHKITNKTFVDKINFIFYKIGLAMYDNGIKNFDKISVFTYLDKRPELKTEFELAGGYDMILEMIEYLTSKDDGNAEYHIKEMMKFQCLRMLYDKGFISKENTKNIETLISSDIEEVRLYLNHQITQSLTHVNSSNYEIYDLIDNDLYKVIENAKKGVQGSIPFYNASRLTKLTKGWIKGRLYYLAMPSGLGKSTIARNIFLPSIIENKENSIIFVNEETKSTWQLNLLITIANMKFHDEGSVYKETIFQGGFSEKDEDILKKAADWLIDNAEDFIIKIVALKSYRFSDVSKILEEYRPYGITTAILDTFKPTAGRGKDMARWEEFGENAQELYDLIKEENMNIRCLATVQARIGYKERFLTLDCIGKSKEISEVADVAMLCREVFTDECKDEINELKVYKYRKDDNSPKGYIKEEIKLSPDKKYIIMFFGKNRYGTDREQLVYEINYDRNIIYEVGFTEIRQSSII